MKRTIYISLILILCILSFSCRKNEKNESAVKPLTLEPSPATLTLASGESGLVLPDGGEQNEKAEGTEDFLLGEVYRGGSILIKAEFTSSCGTLYFNIPDDEILSVLGGFASSGSADEEGLTYVLSSGELRIAYPASTEEEIEERWKNFKDYLNSYNAKKSEESAASTDGELVVIKEAETVKGKIEAVIHSDRMEIMLPEGFSSDDLNAFLSFVIAKHPEILTYGTLSDISSPLVFTYSPSFTGSDASSFFSLLTGLVDEMFSTLPEETEVPEVTEENGVEETLEEKASDVVPSAADTKKRKASMFSVSLVSQNSYAPDEENKFAYSGYVQVDYAIRENFSLGVMSGYDAKSFVPLGLSARYYTHIIPSVYIEGMFGGNIGVGKNMNYGEYFTVVSLGYEYSFSSLWSIFSSFDFSYIWGSREKSRRYGISLGGRVSF